MPVCPLVQTFLARWLVALDVVTLLIGLGLGIAGTPRGYLLALLVPIAIGPFTYARWRLHRSLAPALGDRGATVLAVIGITCDVVLFAQLLTARAPETLPFLHGDGIGWIGPVWFSTHALWLGGHGIAAAVRGLRRLGQRGWALIARTSSPPDAPESPERREFLQYMGAAAAVVPFAAAASGVPLSYDFRVEERELIIPGWPRALDGLRVVHLSDIHVGGGMTRERLLRVAELTNACQPDFVAHTGDFLIHASGDFDAPLYEALSRVRAPLGQWACLGNHDYDDADRFVRRLGDAGVTTLRDRLTRLEIDGQPLELGGLEFVFRPTPRAASHQRIIEGWGERTNAPRLLLNHDPSTFGALPADAASLVLSGHTHGGHVGMQLGKSHAITVIGLVGLPDQGVFARGDMRLFVTRCVGFYGYPMRVGIPPEISLLILRTPGSPTAGEPVRSL
ncbi:MAG TPA: metallophosphoesterase [Candidatus Binatia bacterium]|nr:metallophosphoesterase [Candidatus Binatia bacterium]